MSPNTCAFGAIVTRCRRFVSGQLDGSPGGSNVVNTGKTMMWGRLDWWSRASSEGAGGLTWDTIDSREKSCVLVVLA